MTRKQVAFIEEYCVDRNATQAAIRAGYSKKTAGQVGFENLKKPDIAEAIRQRLGEHAENCGVTKDSITRELDMAYAVAMKHGQASAMVAATTHKAKLHGLSFDGQEAPNENKVPLAERLKAYEREDAIDQSDNVKRLSRA